MAAGLRSGYAAKLYRNTATWASPVWDEITAVQNVTLNLSKSMAEVKARLSGVVQNIAVLHSISLDFNMIHDTSIADHNVLRDAFIAGTTIGWAVADDAIATSGTDHFRFEGPLSKWDWGQQLEESQMVDCTAVPVYSTNVPLWTDVA